MASELEPLFDKRTNDEFQASDVNERHNFVMRVYTILMFMLAMTVGICAVFMTNDNVNHWVDKNSTAVLIPCVIMLFVFEFMILCIPKFRYEMPYNFIVLFLFTFCMSILMGIVTAQYDTNIVLIAFAATGFITIGLTLFAMQTKYDFTGLGPYLLALLLGLIFMGIIQIWVHDHILNTVVASIGAIVFSFYIIMDTQMIMGGNRENSVGPDEYIIGALMLYLDIINLFLYLLKLLNEISN